MKRALMLNAIDPAIGGVLIRGDRGTAKSSAVRALGRLLPDYDAVDLCPYRCDPAVPSRYCDDCRRRASAGRLPVVRLPMRIVELPINASEDRLVGSIDIEAAVRAGTRRFQPGVLAEANRPKDIDQRLRVMELEREFIDNPQAVQRDYVPQETELRGRLQAATTRLDRVQVSDAIRALIARLCLDGSVAGHRADLVVARTARAICALRGAAMVELADVLEALELAMAHRRREPVTEK